MPASASARSSSLPAGPTNGWPLRSSASPGCSPTSISAAPRGPSPNTVCVPIFQRSQPRQSFDASRAVLQRRPRRDEVSRALRWTFGHVVSQGFSPAFCSATATLRRKPCTLVRFIGLPRSAAVQLLVSSFAPASSRSTRSQAGARLPRRSRPSAAPSRSRDTLPGRCRSRRRASRSRRDAPRGCRRAARSSGRRCSGSSRARRARRSPASGRLRCTACTCRTDPAPAHRPRAAGCR